MRYNIILLVLISCLCVTAAFASETATVNIPFSFESQGEHFPASQYEVHLSDDHHHLTMSSKEVPAKHIFLTVEPAEIDPYAANLSIRFDNVGGVHELSWLRLGSYEYKH